MSEPVWVIRWDDFRLVKPLPTNREEFAALLMTRNLGFSFRDEPALYVRKLMDRLLIGDGVVCVEGRSDGEPYRVDWRGFVDAVRKYHGDEEAAKVLIRLTHLTGEPELNN